MRLLMLHVNEFTCRLTEKGRSQVVEPGEPKVTSVGEALVVLASVEKGDEGNPSLVAQRAAAEIRRIAETVKARVIVLHSFAHLFADLATPLVAIAVLDETRQHLEAAGYTVHRPPFGWFNELDIKAKGHPLSRVARIVSAEP
jgi:threonyl-tRNA synthetase